MLRAEAITIIQTVLGFRTDLEDKIIVAMKAAQIMLERGPSKPWFITSEPAAVLTTIAEKRVLLPTDFLMEKDNSHLYYIPADTELPPVALVKDELDLLQENYKDEEPGEPEAYAIIGNYLVLYPTPDALYTIQMRYAQEDSLLDTNVENAWLKYFPYALIGKAGWLIASSIRDGEAVKTFREMESEARIAIVSNDTERDIVNRELQIGGPH